MARVKRNIADKFNTPLAIRLRFLIEKSGITQNQLAQKLGKTRQAINSYTLGITVPDSDTIVKLSQFFDVSSDYLLGLSEAKTSDKDLQYVCNFTGLSEESVLKFNFHKELIRKSGNTCPKPLYSLIYDYFISSDNLFKIAHIISSYVTSKIELANNNKRNNDLYKKFHSYLGEFSDIDKIPQEFIDNYTNQITQICENEPVIEKYCKFALFDAQESIKDFAIKFAEKYLEEGIVYRTSNEANNE